MPCPFYGKHAVENMKVLASQGGNECGLVTSRYAPCAMETAGVPVEFEKCDWHGAARASEFALFEHVSMGNGKYPD